MSCVYNSVLLSRICIENWKLSVDRNEEMRALTASKINVPASSINTVKISLNVLFELKPHTHFNVF